MSRPLDPPVDGAEPPTQLVVIPVDKPSILTLAAYPAAAAVVMIVTEAVSPIAMSVLIPVVVLIFGVAVVVSVVVK